jgi:hypothetical protein
MIVYQQLDIHLLKFYIDERVKWNIFQIYMENIFFSWFANQSKTRVGKH